MTTMKGTLAYWKSPCNDKTARDSRFLDDIKVCRFLDDICAGMNSFQLFPNWTPLNNALT